MADTFNWCFIGTGKMAKTAAGQIVRGKDARHKIISAYSRSFEHTKSFTEKFGGTAYDNLESALSDGRVDGVYISTPHSSHFEYAMKCVERGKAVLVEKPFTLNASQARSLIEASVKNGVYVAEAMWTWFLPVAVGVRQWVRQGEIGQVKAINIKYAMATSKFYRVPRLFDKNMGGGAILDIGVYPIAYCYNLLGYPDSIQCRGKLNEDLIDLGEQITLAYGCTAVCNLSVSLNEFKGLEAAEIIGTEGKIKIPLFHNAFYAKLISGKKREKIRSSPTYRAEFDAAAKEIRAGKIESDFVSQKASLDVMKILDECRRQMGVV